MGAFFIIIICLFIYFAPTIIGWNKKNVGAIFMLNLFLGWTFLGWVVAIIWAFTVDNDPQPQIVYEKPKANKDKFDKLKRLKELADSGAITPSEYEIEKQKILNES
jgi:hypothetical protein